MFKLLSIVKGTKKGITRVASKSFVIPSFTIRIFKTSKNTKNLIK